MLIMLTHTGIENKTKGCHWVLKTRILMGKGCLTCTRGDQSDPQRKRPLIVTPGGTHVKSNVARDRTISTELNTLPKHATHQCEADYLLYLS